MIFYVVTCRHTNYIATQLLSITSYKVKNVNIFILTRIKYNFYCPNSCKYVVMNMVVTWGMFWLEHDTFELLPCMEHFFIQFV